MAESNPTKTVDSDKLSNLADDGRSIAEATASMDNADCASKMAEDDKSNMADNTAKMVDTAIVSNIDKPSKTTDTKFNMADTQSNMADSNGLDAEITELRSVIKGKVRVIDNVGDIWRVVNVIPEDVSVTVKFHLSENYPGEPPEILVSSSKIHEEELNRLYENIGKEIKRLRGEKMLLSMYNFILDALDMDVVSGKLNTQSDSATKKKNKKKKNKDGKNIEEIIEEKGASMKTAIDVIKRIQWDESIMADEFVVGYLDRFIGIVEKYFTAFSWEDLATVDYTVLAIPKHRIQYFKYKTVKVWDKNEKLDNIFGSLGSGITIHDVIREYENNNISAKEIRSNTDEEMKTGQLSKSNETETKSNETESDSDSDDGITVTINETTNDEIEHIPIVDTNIRDVDNEQNTSDDQFWHNKLRPNYFIALRITNPSIHEGVEAVQDHITENDGDYSSCCIPAEMLHVTLCTMRLDTDEAVTKAVQSLETAKQDLAEIVSNADDIRITSLDNFNSRVLYAKLEYPKEFLTMVDHIRLCLNEFGIQSKDVHDFVPHLTVMKISRPFCREYASKKKLDPWLYSGFEDNEFGSQKIDCIHLCEMGEGRNEDGFYKTAVSIDF